MLLRRLKSRGERSRSSSSNSNSNNTHLTESSPSVVDNSRLFALPYDLLEEIATTYFLRREAVVLLTVNSHFHDAFARAVWHTFNPNSIPMKSISDAAWQNYGHLVRCARFYSYQFNAKWCKKVPNLVELTLDITYLNFEVSDDVELLNLRRVQFVTHESGWATSAALKCMDWVCQLEQRNKSFLIEWYLHGWAAPRKI
ncbi:hypothetical protein GQ42DRAFT_162729 [Ramicandelaber brevisporus]|nr:hypothetical protein GQ42DRAFT_162729 [Ramicandelaber brevisporus]